MHLHPYCFSYAIIDRDLNQIIDFEAKVLGQSTGRFLHKDSIAIWFSDHHDIFGLPFKTSKVAVYSPEFTVLPDKTDKPAEVFRLLGFSDSDNITYLKNKLSDSFYVYYSLPDKTINFIENHLPNVEFYSIDFGLLNFYNNKLSFKNYIAANLYGEELTLCYKKASGNFYYNKFPVKAKEDLLYYLRLAYEHLELDLNEFPTYLYGYVEEKSPMYSTTYGYIRNFEIDRTLKNILPFLYGVEEMQLHYYINLLGLGL
ncbi:MAG: DUF3822 family protein [Sphingobacteriales bacterium]|nr:DUF3822 family protein [Sphingobacteriales bacterium]